MPIPNLVDRLRGLETVVLVFDAGGQFSDGRRVEERLDGQIDSESIAQFGYDLNGEKRVASQIRKIVIDPHVLDPKRMLPYLSNPPLDFIPRRIVVRR